MNNLKQWFAGLPKLAYIIAVAVLIIVFLLSMRNCSNNRQDDQTVISAVAQSKIDQLQTDNDALKSSVKASQSAIDSLQTIIKTKDGKIATLNTKVAYIASNYEKEKNRLQLLTDNDAVAEFLDASDCGEQPIIKYDSMFLIDICPIRNANDIRAGFDMQVNVNQVLQDKLRISESKASDYNGIIAGKDKQLTDALQLNSNSEKIITEKDKQIVAEHKKFRQQKVKTWITGGIGVVLLTLAIIY
jgi:hypothetical protein